MPACCQINDEPKHVARSLTVALAGNPNSGKTTIFNALTGLRQKVANYPGVTVEKKTGRCRLAGGSYAQIVDLPGTYSLVSRSPDEQVAMEVVRGLRSDTPAPDVVVVVVDASNLQRNLYLVSQLIELGKPLVVALNMMDVAQRRGLRISAQRLESLLGVGVIPVVGHKRRGIEQLKAAILCAKVAPMPDWPLPPAMHEEVTVVGGALGLLAPELKLDQTHAIAERLLIGDRAKDMAALCRQEPVASLLNHADKRLGELGIDPMQADIEAHYHWIDSVAAAALTPSDQMPPRPGDAGASAPTLTDKVDRILVHKFWGLLIFAGIMAALFVSIFWLAQPIMDALQKGIVAAGDWATRPLGNGPLRSMLFDGVINGVGIVMAFVPQIALLFMFLAILEDSGYLARAAFLMDKLLSRVGLHGKSFIPLLSSFACAIPGIMATRTMESRRDRLATIFIAPFMSCSARLPIYLLIVGTLFAQCSLLSRAGIMLGCYSMGVIVAAGTAWLFRRTLLKGGVTTFILELPSYKLPQLTQVARQVWTNAGQFVTKAGTVILAFSILLWALSYYPRHSGGGGDNAAMAAQSEYSYAGRLGHAMEPALRPLGFDWKMGVGLIGAFAARETFVSTMGITYSMGKIDADHQGIKNLGGAMVADHYADGKPVWTPLVGISLLVWFILALQCMSTVAVVRRETGGWRWPIFMILYMNALAYVASLAVFQIGSHLMRG